MALVVADGNLRSAGESYCRGLISAAENAEWSLALQLDNGTDRPSRQVLRRGSLQAVEDEANSINYGDADMLADFFRWAAASAPAERYAVVVFGHGVSACGLGWDGTPAGSWPAIAMDASPDAPPLRPAVLSDALNKGLGGKADVLVLDCCYGASMEIVWDLRRCARVVLASPGRTLSSGVPWPDMLEKELPPDPLVVARGWADAAEGTVAVRTSGLWQVAERIGRLSSAAALSIERIAPALTQARSECSAWGWQNEMCDLYALCRRLADATNGEAATAAIEAAEAVDGCILSDRRTVTVPFLTGLQSRGIVHRPGGFGDVSGWDEMVGAYHDRQQELMRRTLDDRRHGGAAI